MTETEGRILEAAKREFIQNGLKGTSMQQIADAAGIHKSLLHYYFRSKEKLFAAVFSAAFNQFLPKLFEIATSDATIFVKIERIVDKYIDLLMENPFLPVFILHEINRNPDRMYELMKQSGIDLGLVREGLISERDRELIRPVNPVHLMVNTIALCIFPVAARTLLEKAFFQNDHELMQGFLQERKAVVTDFIIHAIAGENSRDNRGGYRNNT
jgi:AcrR family transcriptional regulator